MTNEMLPVVGEHWRLKSDPYKIAKVVDVKIYSTTEFDGLVRINCPWLKGSTPKNLHYFLRLFEECPEIESPLKDSACSEDDHDNGTIKFTFPIFGHPDAVVYFPALDYGDEWQIISTVAIIEGVLLNYYGLSK